MATNMCFDSSWLQMPVSATRKLIVAKMQTIDMR